MDETREIFINRIHDSGTRLVISATGGGSQAIAWLLAVPGASQSVLEARVPYSAAALVDWLRAQPEQYCAERTARAMAMCGYLRAQQLAHAGKDAGDNLAGVGCTASLASRRPKLGQHRLHVAIQTPQLTASSSLILKSGARSRGEEEHLAAELLLQSVAAACGLIGPDAVGAELPIQASGETLSHRVCRAPHPWVELLAGRIERHCEHGAHETSDAAPAVVFPGAFNPLHAGHQRMRDLAERICQAPVAFELSIDNVDKHPLDFLEISERLEPLAALGPIWLTRAAKFTTKARLFPGATFVVGADTIARLADPKYYNHDPAARDAAISELAACGSRFLVFGRASDGDFHTLRELPLPARLAAICTAVEADMFRMDISSTELRRQAEG